MNPTYRNHGCRLMSCRVNGQQLLFLENELLRVGVWMDKGADIVQFLYKPNDVEFLLHTGRGITPPSEQSVASASWGSFLDRYAGGWQEILPNGGPTCTYKGIEFGLHGEISTVPWQCLIQTDEPDRVEVCLEVRPSHTPFHLVRRMALRRGVPTLFIEETLTNEGREAMDYMWGHHPAFGQPFLGPDCRIDLPLGELVLETFGQGAAGTRLQQEKKHIWPRAVEGEKWVDFSRPDPPGTGHEDLGYVINLPEGWYALANPKLDLGFALTWSLDVFPYLWVWRQFNRSSGYPWYGRVYTLGLEPWSSYPSAGLTTALDNGTAALLEPGESVNARLTATAFLGSGRVVGVSPTGKVTFEGSGL